MPNAVKYSTTQPSEAIKKGDLSISPGGDLGPTNTTGWFNGVVPQGGKYIVYDANAAYSPRIYAPQNSDELKRVALQLGASSGDVTSEAAILSWFATQTKWSIVNKSYPNIVTDQLVYLIDSTFTPSYPTTGTTAYPISDRGDVGNGTLQNGVGFNSTTGAFIFDGSDDQIPLFGSDQFSTIDFSTGFTMMVLYKIDALTDFNGQFRCMIGVTGGGRTWNYYLYGPNNPATYLLYHFSGVMSNGLSSAVTVTTDTYHLAAFVIEPGTSVGTYYHDARLISTQNADPSPYYTTAGGTQYLGRGDNMWKGNIAKWMIYNKALTQDEINQNFYQGNIVTNGLIMYWDAGNLISYSGSGTTIYDLSLNSNYGILVNGVSFTSQFGGGLDCDPTDEFIVCNNPLDTNYVSVELFYTRNSAAGNVDDIVVNKEGVWEIKDVGGSLEWAVNTNNQGWFWQPTGFTIAVGETAHIVLTYDGNTVNFYKNGSLYSYTYPSGGVLNTGAYPKFNSRGYGKFDVQYPGDRNMYVYRIYNRALTQAEVNQNYSAQASRFK